MATVLVTGATGQIGSYLVEELVREGHAVLVARRPGAGGAPPEGTRAARGELTVESAMALVHDNGPLDAIVHLAGRSTLVDSWETPMDTFEANGRLAVALAFAVAKAKTVRFVQASSAEIFGIPPTPVQDEETPIAPISPYGVAKAAAHVAVRVGREGYGAPMSNLILFASESPRRSPHFVFRKITQGVARIARGKLDVLTLGSTSAIRDFSHAKDHARAAKLLALGAPAGDYVCASGEGHTIQDVVDAACARVGLDPARAVVSDQGLARKHDIPSRIGDNRRLRGIGWAPSVTFSDLIREMVDFDLRECS